MTVHIVSDPRGIEWQLGEKLGQGGFASVYRASRKDRPIHIAFKIVKSVMTNKKIEEKFISELRIHSKIRHPYILKFLFAFSVDEYTYVGLDLCPNGCLKDMVSRRKCLSMPEIRRFGIQICGGLDYLHARGVIHRDVKLANIMLDANMDIKIGDFGLAALLLSSEDEQRRRTRCGTPNYMAPEILDATKGGHDRKVDVFAYGCLIYALMTGKPPFSRPGDKGNEVIAKRMRDGDYNWPEGGENEISEKAKDLVACCLRVDPQERPQMDDIYSHSFFASPNIPSKLDVQCILSKPTWLRQQSPYGDVVGGRFPRITLDKLVQKCKESSRKRSVYRECETEAIPVLPLDPRFVYEFQPRETISRPISTRIKLQKGTLVSSSLPSSSSKTTGAVSSTSTTTTTTTKSSSVPDESPKLIFSKAERALPVSDDDLESISRLESVAHLLGQYVKDEKPRCQATLLLNERECKRPPLVAAWVDYSQKYGVGYFLADGSIGCIFTRERQAAVSVFVAYTMDHWKNVLSHDYKDRQQWVLENGAPVEFFQRDLAIDYIMRLGYSAKDYKRAESGKEFVNPTKDEWDQRRRAYLSTWTRFAKHMAETYPWQTGQPQKKERIELRKVMARPYVQVFQRLGNVVVFVFSDGSLQFNFTEDDTKLSISNNGAMADFYCWPVCNADEMDPIEPEAFVPCAAKVKGGDCQVISMALLDMLRGGKNGQVWDIVLANGLREKVIFAKDVVSMWAKQGGIGRLGVDKLTYGGPGAEGTGRKKLSWVVVKL